MEYMNFSDCVLNKSYRINCDNSEDFNKHSNLGDTIKLRINYYSGWDWKSSNSIPTVKEVEGIQLGLTYDKKGLIVYFREEQFFSYGNGITVPSHFFVLLKKDNSLGYYLVKDTLDKYIEWSDYIPKWEIIE